MFHINDLQAMEESSLRQIAISMGMKKSSAANTDELVEYILDNQAIGFAKEEAASSARKAPRERKTRTKRTKAPAATTTEGKAAPDSSAPAAETPNDQEAPQPKKRGRKPKQKAAEPTLPLETEPVNNEAVIPSTEKEPATIPVPDAVIAPLADSRPSAPFLPVAIADANSNMEEEAPQAVAAPDPSPANDPPKPTRQHPEADATPAPRQPRQNNNAKEKPGLDSFFSKAKGKTFTPRSQREIEDSSQPTQQPPLQAAEPAPFIEEAPLQTAHPMHAAPAAQPMQQGRPMSKKQLRAQQRLQQQQLRQQQQQQRRQMRQPTNFDNIPLLTVYGVMEVMPDGVGFLRSSDYNYLASPDDVIVTQQQIKHFGLKTGDVVEASIAAPREGDKYYPLVDVASINGLEPKAVRDRESFEHLVPLFPDEKFIITKGNHANISTRVVDMFAPIGKGQRALIVAPPKTGKTILLKDIANAISDNHPETYIIMLLIDERPEEVTDMARSVNAEVIASTFDEPAERHVKIAGIVLEKAKRLVECGHDVVIMLDSITRLARAYNTVSPASGKILSGGVDANALQRPKRFFGAARNIENGGSLTIIATALTETSSKMDEVIFEEFKGTGNMELQLDRKLSNKRIFPAVDITASSTRRDDLLTSEETRNRMWILRNYLADMNSVEAMEFIKKRMEMTRTNEELLVTMDK